MEQNNGEPLKFTCAPDSTRSNEMLVLVSQHQSYGRKLFKAENELAVKLLTLLGKNNFNVTDISNLKPLGYTVETISQKL